MATCFAPLPPGKKQFDFGIPLGRPPRKDFSYRPPRIQKAKMSTCSKNVDERSLSSTYRSFRELNEDDAIMSTKSYSENPRSDFRRSLSLKIAQDGIDSSENHLLSIYSGSSRIRRHRKARNKSKTIDGYSSDTTLLPNKAKPFLSSFKTDRDEFKTALLATMKEKSKSVQMLVEAKKPVISPRLKPVPIPSAELSLSKSDKDSLKRNVTFSENEKDSKYFSHKRRKYSVLKSELPTLTFEDLKKAADTRHPKSLYSTTRYRDLHITIFCGNECINPQRPSSGSDLNTNKATEHTIRNLKLEKNFKRTSLSGRNLFRSQSDGNLNVKDDKKDALEKQGATTFNKYLRVLSGSWRNLLSLGGMNRPSKAVPMAKKVAPPSVPEVFRHSGSSFDSAGYASSEDGYIPLPSSDGQSNISDRSDIYGMSGKSPSIGGQFNYQSFTFPGKGVYYHHQQSLQEDQGIDMSQSPGRDSPGSSGSGSGSRHSTASLDSGRASGSHFHGPRAPCSTLSSSPRCSISSSSIVSSENGPPGARVERLIHQGVPDQDVVHAWLQDLHFEEYFTLFASAGYDMPTISKMTPEDLTAIGIKKPNHRKKLKAEIAQLNISDGLPDYIPGNMEEWLTLLRLEEYISTFRQQGYETIEDVTQLAWEDLEEAGVVKLGHQKRLMLAIKRVKDIRAGKRFSNLPSHSHITQAELHTPSPGSIESSYSQTPTRPFRHPWDLDATRHFLGFSSPYCPDIVPIKIRGGRGKSLESLEDGERTGTHHTFSAENTATFYFNNNIQLQSGGWRRSYEDGDITPTNEATVALHEGGGTLPRPRGLVRPRPVAKIPATRNTTSHYFEKPSYNIYDLNTENFKKCELMQSDLSSCDLQEKCIVPPSMAPIAGVYDYKYRYSVAESSPGVIHNNSALIHNSPAMRRRPPSPPKRQNSHSSEIQNSLDCNTSKDCGLIQQTTVVELHAHPSVPLPNYDAPLPSNELSSHLETLHIGWRNETAEEEEQKLIAALAQQTRNGSDASFKSSSSTESDSLPFANENAGTIKQRARCQTNEFQNDPRNLEQEQEPADVLSDIGNMLANLTDELDAMLEEEKRQGLNLD